MIAPRTRLGDTGARATALAVGWAGGLVLLLLSAPLAVGLHYVGLDLTRLDLGMACELKGLLQAGASLLLAPHLGDGAPLLGRPGAQLFYPVRWLVLPLPVDLAVSAGVILHLALAAASTSWLVRAHGVRPAGAVMAGVFFAFSGVCLNLIVHSYYVVGAAWLPLAWAAARRSLRGHGSVVAPLLAALAVALSLLGGEPQAALLGLALIGVELARVRAWRPAWRLRAARLLLATLGGLALGLLPWWSFFAEARLGGRASRLSIAALQHWSFEPALWAAAVLPGELFAQPRPGQSLWLDLVGTDGGAWNQAPYLGALFAASFIAALCCRRARVPAGLALAAGILALGSQLPLLALLARLLPPLALFRYPEKYLVLAALAAIVATWVGLERVQRGGRALRAQAIAVATMLVGMLALAAAIWAGRAPIDRAAVLVGDATRFPELGHLASTLVWACLRAALPLLVALTLLWRERLRRAPLGLLLVLDVTLAGLPGLPVGAGLSDLRSPLAQVRTDDQDRTRLCVAYFKRELVEQQPDAAGREHWTQMALYRLYLVPDLQACDGMVSPLLYSPLQTQASENLQVMLDTHRVAAARALGCSHLLAARPPVDQPAVRVPLPGQGDLVAAGPQLYAVPDPLPDVVVVREPRLAADLRSLLDAVADSRSAADVSRFIDDPLGRLAPEVRLPGGDGVQQVRLTRLATARLRLDLAGHGAAVVGVRQSFWSGWSAQQAGRGLPVLRLAGQQLAVVVDEVSAGPIELRYQAPHLWRGFAVALAGVFCLGLATQLPTRGRRRAP